MKAPSSEAAHVHKYLEVNSSAKTLYCDMCARDDSGGPAVWTRGVPTFFSERVICYLLRVLQPAVHVHLLSPVDCEKGKTTFCENGGHRRKIYTQLCQIRGPSGLG